MTLGDDYLDQTYPQIVDSYELCEDDFDDIVHEDECTWATICPNCLSQMQGSFSIDTCAGQEICGIEGCQNEAEYYITKYHSND